MKTIPLFIAIALLFTSCSSPPLLMQSDYVHYEDLASYRIGTPDPRKECPDSGQKLIVSWDLHQLCLKHKKTELLVTIRFGNREEQQIRYLIDRQAGHEVYYLLNDEYYCKKGLSTYKAEVFADGELVACWHHQLWTELIKLQPDVGAELGP